MDLHQILEIRSRGNGEQHRSPVEGTQRRGAVGSGFQRAVKRSVGGNVGFVGNDLPGGLDLGVGMRIVDGEVSPILPRRADNDLARVRIELPRLGPDHADLVLRARAALDQIVFEFGRRGR